MVMSPDDVRLGVERVGRSDGFDVAVMGYTPTRPTSCSSRTARQARPGGSRTCTTCGGHPARCSHALRPARLPERRSRASGFRAARVTAEIRRTIQSGGMFWFSRNRFVGSYVRLSAFSRSYFSAPYAWRIRDSPSAIRKLT
jgi:hypothetical protein